MLHQAGAKILVGTDAPEPQVAPGYSLHKEMELLVEAGMSPASVLQAATRVNAEVLREENHLGASNPESSLIWCCCERIHSKTSEIRGRSITLSTGARSYVRRRSLSEEQPVHRRTSRKPCSTRNRYPTPCRRKPTRSDR